MKIPFNKAVYVNSALGYIEEVLKSGQTRGDAAFCAKCSNWLEETFQAKKIFLTPSCSHSLEMAAILCDIQPGDEVIMPAYTFVSTANAFVLRGAKIVFVDIRPDTQNIDESLIEAAITKKTKVIVPVHYAGVACEMDKIMEIARRHKLLVVEDAAQGVMSTYKGKALGTIGDFGCYSFHETKNYSMGEGGAISINHPEFTERAAIIREKGTNRDLFLRGQVDKYTWVEYGSSYLPSDLSAAYLYSQLEIAEEINQDRLQTWKLYYEELNVLQKLDLIDLPIIPKECNHNAHMFYIKTKNIEERTNLISYLKSQGIIALFHYVPLHTAMAGQKYGVFSGNDTFTTKESERLVRLPMYYGLSEKEVDYVIHVIKSFYGLEKSL